MHRLLILAVGAIALGVVGWLAVQRLTGTSPVGTLYGNVEIRQVDLAFNSEGTVTTMPKQEGDPVHAGEVIARLDDATYRQAEALSEGRRDEARAQLDKLLHGTRREDIDQARASLAAAKAALVDALATFNRQQALAITNASTRQLLDDARHVLDASQAQVVQTQAVLDEAVNGPRIEDIDAARAQLRSAEAALDLARTQLARTELKAPCEGIVMTRVIEPGTVVMPTSAVYSVAMTSEVWVRGFVPEPMLSRVAPGTVVHIVTDGQPRQPYRGRVGYVSPAAEFTPKTVETPELRTQLVYRVRVRVENPDDKIRQGQPVTILLPGAS